MDTMTITVLSGRALERACDKASERYEMAVLASEVDPLDLEIGSELLSADAILKELGVFGSEC